MVVLLTYVCLKEGSQSPKSANFVPPACTSKSLRTLTVLHPYLITHAHTYIHTQSEATCHPFMPFPSQTPLICPCLFSCYDKVSFPAHTHTFLSYFFPPFFPLLHLPYIILSHLMLASPAAADRDEDWVAYRCGPSSFALYNTRRKNTHTDTDTQEGCTCTPRDCLLSFSPLPFPLPPSSFPLTLSVVDRMYTCVW